MRPSQWSGVLQVTSTLQVLGVALGALRNHRKASDAWNACTWHSTGGLGPKVLIFFHSGDLHGRQ